MSKTYPIVWIVVPTWNRRDDLLACLTSIADLDYPEKRVVVVDNGSTDGSAEAVRRYHPGNDLIALEHNLGATEGANLGFKFALENEADYVLRLDSDTILAKNFLTIMVNAAQANPSFGLLVGKVFYFSNPSRIWSLGARQTSRLFAIRDLREEEHLLKTRDQILEIDYAWATGMFLSRWALTLLGGFDTDFFVYYEEMDFCQRCRDAGLKMGAVPAAEMWHKIGELSQSPWVAYNWARGKMLFFRKHSNGFHRLLLVIYAYSYALFRTVVPKEGAGNRGPLKSALAGLTAGLRYRLDK